MTNASISVVIPARNGAEYLPACLKSIYDQDLPAAEVILVDDGSDQDLDFLFKDFKSLIKIRQEKFGCAKARNEGIKVASGEIIAFLDADDLWLKNKLLVQIPQLLKSDCLISYTKARNFFDNANDQFPEWAVADTFSEQGFTAYIPSTLVCRREIFEGGNFFFDESYSVCSDMEWFFRMRDSGQKMLIIDQVLSMRRVHESNLGHLKKENFQAKMRILAASAKRKG